MTRRRATIRTAAAVLAVAALVAVPSGAGGGGAEAALPVTPGESTPPDPERPKVQVENQVDNRTVDSAIGIGKDANVYVWGRTGYGMNGIQETDWSGDNSKEWPVKVTGLPEGSIVKVASGIYNFNALDTSGHVWGWGGWYPSRDGTGVNRSGSSCSRSVGPARLRVGSAWNGSGPLLSGMVNITATEYAGAGIAADGTVYHWGRTNYGGNYTGGDTCTSTAGATRLAGLPDPSIEGNFPVYIKGGYRTFWVILENGDVYYWGGSNTYERPRAADGGNGDYSSSDVRTATKSTVFDAWLRSNPGVQVVSVDSGINLGGALLSDGRVLTWGTSASRVGGRLPNSSSADTNRQARTLGLLPNMSNVVHLAYTFTGGAMITADGDLYGYGDDSYECFPRWPNTTIFCGGGVRYPTVPGHLDTDVVSFSVGQGYIRWKKWVPDSSQPDGVRYESWAQGYNPRGAVGHPRGTVNSKRPLVFFQRGNTQLCTEPRCDLAALLR